MNYQVIKLGFGARGTSPNIRYRTQCMAHEKSKPPAPDKVDVARWGKPLEGHFEGFKV